MNINIRWNLIAESRGAHERGTLAVQTSDLRGYALDYVLALLSEFPSVIINYESPDFRIAEVQVEDVADQGYRPWSPSTNPSLANEVLNKLAGSKKISSDRSAVGQLRELIEDLCGATVHIPYPVLRNQR
nr:hypothetical protein [uncultured Massilia sp.]